MVIDRPARISVLLVDDHSVVREGYRRLLERHGEVDVIGEASEAAGAYSLFCRLDPQIVVMDISLPGSSGINALRRMLNYKAAARVLMFSMHDDVIFARRAMRAGAYGYVTKSSAPDVLVEAIHSVAAGRMFLSADVAQKLALHEFAASKDEDVSARELEVLNLLAQGWASARIGRHLGISPKTVDNHRSAIKQKLNAGTAAELLKAAVQMGLGHGTRVRQDD